MTRTWRYSVQYFDTCAPSAVRKASLLVGFASTTPRDGFVPGRGSSAEAFWELIGREKTYIGDAGAMARVDYAPDLGLQSCANGIQ